MPRRNLVWILAVSAVSLICWQTARSARPEVNFELYGLFVDAMEHVEANYVRPVNRRELIEGALQGMLQSLDQYSNYIDPDDWVQFKKTTTGHFGGIGIQIQLDDKTKQLMVLSPLVGTPAYEAGILPGDKILEINGHSTEGTTLDKAVQQLTGKPNSKVILKILHEGDEDPVNVTLERHEIKIQSVLGDHMKDNDTWDYMIDHDRKIGYIRITSFIQDTAADLHKAIDELKSQGMKALIIDLRFNPGGLLTSAIEVSDLFVKSGAIVSTRGRNQQERSWEAHPENTYSDFPIAVLVNHYSASASEIVSACLQDHKRAAIVGQRTWGKGSVQNVIELEGGRSALKLTTATYWRPNNHNIHRFRDAKESDEWGVKPNPGLEVVLKPSEMIELVKERKNRDVAHGKRLKKAQKAADKPGAESKPAPKPKPLQDPQLQKAESYLTDVLAGKIPALKEVAVVSR